jgi:prevent-host-death family protein
MTVIGVEEYRAHPDQYLAETARGDVVLTQNGKRWIVLRGVEEDQDRLSAAYAKSPAVWRMIQQRREEQGIPWEAARRQLDQE